jgi:1-acyl-sn-glycerol-3-phosphate acyltransferase
VKLYTLLERTGFRQLAKWLYKVEVTGADRIPPGPVILVANHESLFDPWILALATPRPVRYMAKSELWRYRLVGAAMESFGAFPVERGTGDTTALSRAAELLRQGDVLGIFPQGTSKRLAQRPYHRGAARLALSTGAPLVPVGMTATRRLPSPWGRRRTLIKVGDPMYVDQARPTVAAAKKLTTELERQISRNHD